MIDAADRASARFPASAVGGVADRIAAWIEKHGIVTSYSSAAAGGDILFLECAQSVSIETHIILPFSASSFVGLSVSPAGSAWVDRFDAVLGRAASVTILNRDVSDYQASAFDFANRMIGARASARATTLDAPLHALALWDGRPGDGAGGTADAAAYWTRAKIPLFVIHPTQSELDGPWDSDESLPERPFPQLHSVNPAGVTSAVVSFLYLRFGCYRTLTENDLPVFFRDIIGEISSTLISNGWYPARYGFGENYLLVWQSTREAVFAGIEIASLVNERLSRFSGEMSLGAYLHCAPAQILVNPLLNQYSHEGAAVARLEEIGTLLSPGVIFATEPFADLLAFEKVRDVRCEYAGTVGATLSTSGYRVYQISRSDQ